MVCKCSLVERLDLLPMAVLLMIGGKLPARRAQSAHFVGHLPFHEGDTFNEAALKALILEAVGLNKSKANEPSFYESHHS